MDSAPKVCSGNPTHLVQGASCTYAEYSNDIPKGGRTMYKNIIMALINAILSLIGSDLVRGIVRDILGSLPTYWWTAPASTSGKYHPFRPRRGRSGSPQCCCGLHHQ